MPTTAGWQLVSSGRGQQRSELPRDVWKLPGKPLEFGREQFFVSLGGRNIDPLVEGVSWDDVNAVLTGEIRLRDPADGPQLNIDHGGEVVLSYAPAPGRARVVLWRMRVLQPSREFFGMTRSLQLTNALGWLAKSTDDFKYVKNKKHPQGWTCDQIVRDICKRYNVPVGTIVRGTHRIKSLVKFNASPLDVIAEAYRRERRYTNKRYVLSCYLGKLNITPLRRSARLLELGPTLIQASFQETMREDFATALSVRATGKKRKSKDKEGNPRTDTTKINVKVSSPGAIRKFGYVHKNWTASDADTPAEARAAGLRHLTTVGKPLKELALTHPGMPDIRRGDAVKALLPDKALNQVIFITEARHTVGPGSYTMDLQVTFTDPFVDAVAAKAEKKKAAAAKKRGRTHKKKKPRKPAPKGAAQRGGKLTPGQELTRRGNP